MFAINNPYSNRTADCVRGKANFVPPSYTKDGGEMWGVCSNCLRKEEDEDRYQESEGFDSDECWECKGEGMIHACRDDLCECNPDDLNFPCQNCKRRRNLS